MTDYMLMVYRLRPGSAYHNTGAAGYAAIGEWRDPNTAKPSQAECDAEWIVYEAEQAAAAAQAATIANAQAAAVSDYATMPAWAHHLTAAEAETYVTGQIWSGMTLTQVESWIDANVTTIATTRTALKQVAGAVINMRGLFVLTVKLLVYIRDLVIRWRT